MLSFLGFKSWVGLASAKQCKQPKLLGIVMRTVCSTLHIIGDKMGLDPLTEDKHIFDCFFYPHHSPSFANCLSTLRDPLPKGSHFGLPPERESHFWAPVRNRLSEYASTQSFQRHGPRLFFRPTPRSWPARRRVYIWSIHPALLPISQHSILPLFVCSFL